MTTDELALFASLRPNVEPLDDSALATLRLAIWTPSTQADPVAAATTEAELIHLLPLKRSNDDAHFGDASRSGPGRRRRLISLAVAAALLTGIAMASQLRSDPVIVTSNAAPLPDTTVPATLDVTTAATLVPSPEPSSTSTGAPAAPRFRQGEPTTWGTFVETTPAWDLTVFRGIEAAIDRCVAEHGLTYTHRPDLPSRPAFVEGPHDADYRRAYGYGIPASPKGSDEAWVPFFAQLQNPAMNELIMGHGDAQMGDCQGRAYHEIYPPDGASVAPAQATLNQAARVEFEQKLAESSGIAAAAKAWSACMATKGTTAATPNELALSWELQRQEAHPDVASLELPPTADEVAVALQDWECQQSTGFVDVLWGTQQELTAAFSKSQLIDVAKAIAEVKQWQRAVAERASAAINALPNHATK